MKNLLKVCVTALMLVLCSNTGASAQSGMGNSNRGTDFWFSFPVAYTSQQGGNGGIKIYVSCDTSVQCRLEIPASGKIITKNTVANGVIRFDLTPAEAQVYEKSDRPGTAKTEEETWQEGKGRGIHISAPVPITVYGLSYFVGTMDSFLALPTAALGKEYIVASYADLTSSFAQLYLPSQTVIVAAYDNTSVNFTLGGSSGTQTVGSMNRGETKTFMMNKGDVIAFANKKAKSGYADISGSKIIASRPVAVISGNQSAYVDVTTGASDYLAEMELPTNTWGTEYNVTPMYGRKNYSFIKIFAKNPNTRLYRDGSSTPFAILTTSGGNNGTGYYEGRLITDGSSPRPVTITADGPISITQFNPGALDDNYYSDPFQMLLTPVEQYQHEITFHSLEIIGEPKSDYLNLVFEANSDGTMPGDLEFGTPNNSDYTWQSIRNMFGGSGQQISGSKYFLKTIPLTGTNLFKIRSSKSIAGYVYGYCAYGGMGNPASVGLRDLTKNLDVNKPFFTYTQQCDGSIKNGKIIDWPNDPDLRSNLATINLLKGSTNYILEKEDFIPGSANAAWWKLTVENPAMEATANIYASDRAGNDTTITVSYYPPSLKTSVSLLEFGLVKTKDSKTLSFIIENTSATATQSITKIALPTTEKRFAFISLPQLPFTLAPQEKKTIQVSFTADSDGVFKSAIEVEGNNVCTKFSMGLQAHAGTPVITASDLDFGTTRPGVMVEKTISIYNYGTAELSVTGVTGPSVPEFSVQYMAPLSAVNPLVIPFEPGKNEANITIRFLPLQEGNFLGELHFQSDSRLTNIDKTSILSGRAIEPTSVDNTVEAGFTISPNPATGFATITLPAFKSQNVFLKVFDAAGNKVADFSNDLLKTELRFDTKTLPNGTYFLRFTDGERVLSRSFIVKN
ncbi:MAG: choice-of-anchor D domain-containing protein [Bacteroidota bacterium]